MKRVKLFLMFVVLASLPAFNNCGNVTSGGTAVHGTEIGNPFGAGNEMNSQQIVNALCSVLVVCDPTLAQSTCAAGILNAPNITTALGVPPSATTIMTLAALQPYEQAGTIVANGIALQTCVTEIGRLTCAATSVTGAYAPGNATSPFGAAYEMIPADAACSSVY